MTGFKIYLSNGVWLDFPTGGDSAPAVVAWLKDALPDDVITVKAGGGSVMHIQKRHVTHVEETA